MLSWVLTAAVDGHADSAVQAVSLANPTLLAPASEQRLERIDHQCGRPFRPLPEFGQQFVNE